MIGDSVLDLIGSTPMVRINKLNTNKDIKVYAKLEGFNPTGSIKDRVALKMIEEAEKSGELKPGKVILEATSGNTGIGLAMVGSQKGYKVVVVMSSAVSIERRKMMRAFGAEVILTSPDLGTDGAIMKVREMMSEHPDKYYNPNQFSNENNKLAHKLTAEEIWKQTDGKITHFVASLGTSGTLMGVGKWLKRYNDKIKIIEAHPEEGHQIQGLKNMNEAIVPKIYDPSMVDEHLLINTEDAYSVARRIVKEESLFVGMSSGAAMQAVLSISSKLPKESVVVVIFPDRGEKYLSTKLFEL